MSQRELPPAFGERRRVRTSTQFAWVRAGFFAAVFATALASAPVAADDPKPPPDIQAILDKIKQTHQPPTADELQKLLAWQQSIVAKVSNPDGSITNANDIPVRIDVKLHYTIDSPGDHIETDLSAWADVALRANINGTDDFYRTMLDPNAHASSFTFAPVIPRGGAPAPSGGGHYHRVGRDKISEAVDDGVLSRTSASMMLATHGSDELIYAVPQGSKGGSAGNLGGQVVGTRTTKTSNGTRTTKIDESINLDNISSLLPSENFLARRNVQPVAKGHLSYRDLVDAIRGGKTKRLTYNEDFDWVDGATHTKGTTSVAITLKPPKVDLVIEPVDQGVYESWLPTPADETSIFGKSEPLGVRVRVRDRGSSGAGSASLATHFTFSLRDVSELPGTATNYPIDATDGGNKPSDLRFAKQEKQPKGIVVDDERHAHSTDAVPEAIVYVEATDSGAWGKVQAEAPDLGIVATNPKTQAFALELPLASDGDHIADAWKRPRFNGKSALSDEDLRMGQRDTGDGYTLFEEYRGFVALEDHGEDTYRRGIRKHVRTDPDAKDVFCHDSDTVVLRYYFPENPSHLHWHFVDAATMRLLADTTSPETRRINTNTPPELRYAYQYGIEAFVSRDTGKTNSFVGGSSGIAVLRDDLAPQDNRPTSDNPQGKAPADYLYPFDNPIHSYKYLVIWPVNVRAQYEGILQNPTAGPAWKGDAGKALLLKMIEGEIKSTVIHEIGHYLGIHHHWVAGGKLQHWDPKKQEFVGDNPQRDDSQYAGTVKCAMRYTSDKENANILATGKLVPPNTRYCQSGETAFDSKGNLMPANNCEAQISVKTTR